VQTQPLSRWPVPGGYLDRLGLPPREMERRSRRAAAALVDGRWRGREAELAAGLVYAGGDGGLVELLRFGGDPVGSARAALAGGAPLLVDVAMVRAGIRLPPGRRLAVAVQQPRAAAVAERSGVTRAAAGVLEAWPDFGVGGVVAVGNAPTALLAVLDLARTGGPPACVVATCPGLNLASEAKEALAEAGLPFAIVAGTRGGSGLAAAAVNVLLSGASGPAPRRE
jgi:precorrin-8X/cobalt-precorrin-8 methylmutase